MKKRGLVIGLLVLLAVITSGFTYAFWAASVAADSETATGSVQIGQGNEAVTTVVVDGQTSSGPLVPANRLAQSPNGSVGFVVLQFSVAWDSAVTDLAAGAAGTLAAVVSDVKIDNSTTNAGLVTTEVRIGAGYDANGVATGSTNNAIIVDGSSVIVYVKVTLSEPATQAIYTAIALKAITFTVTFTATPTV